MNLFLIYNLKKMKMIIYILTSVGIIIALWGKILYIKDMISWNTKANRVSRFIRWIAPIISWFASLSDWVKFITIIPVFIAWIWPLLVFLCSFIDNKWYWKLEKFDYICWILSIFAILLRYITKNPVLAIVFSIISDLLASIPTIKKSRLYPETESIMWYVTWLFGIFVSIFTLNIYSFSELAFSIYLLLLCIWITSIIYFRRKNIVN